MAETHKNKIVVVETSDIVYAGLKLLLEESDKFAIVQRFSSLKPLKKYLESEGSRRKEIDALIINPAIIKDEDHAQLKQQLPLERFLLIAIVQDNYPADILKPYDVVLNIKESSQTILDRISAIFDQWNETPKGDYEELSEREKEVLAAIAKGMTYKEIADGLNVSPHTIISHRKNITKKTGISSISGLTVYAIINKLIDVN